MEQLKVNDEVKTASGRTGYVVWVYGDGSASVVWHDSFPPAVRGMGHERVPARLLERVKSAVPRIKYVVTPQVYDSRFWDMVCSAMGTAIDLAEKHDFSAVHTRTKPDNGGCGACGDACASRGGCRIDGDSPQPAGKGACTEFCVNGHLAGNCHLVWRHNELEQTRRT